MRTTFGQAFSFHHISYALLSFGALALSSPDSHAARRPCDCDNLGQIEEHIVQQEFLRKQFPQWTEYMPCVGAHH